MPYTGPDWTTLAISDHIHIRREFDPPHPSGTRLHECSGRINDVSQHGFSLAIDGGGSRFHSWDPGTTCHQTVTRL